jgi:hypothetical protein
VIRFDAHAYEELNLGTIAYETDYRGSYDPAANHWTVTGFNKGDQNIVSFGATNADPTPGSLSVWGMVGRFDEAGTITYLDRPVGKLRPASESPGKE